MGDKEREIVGYMILLILLIATSYSTWRLLMYFVETLGLQYLAIALVLTTISYVFIKDDLQ